ncbi:MAG: ABC transporter permease [Candidatus Nanopelagicales bacterium]
MSSPALAMESLKLRKAAVQRGATGVIVFGVPAMSAGFLAVARSDADGPLAAKVAPMLIGVGWTAMFGFVAQALSVGMLLAAGVVVSWSFGREFTDGTFGALFALPTSRRSIATAKFTILGIWGALTCMATLLVTMLLGTLIGLGLPTTSDIGAAGRALAVGLLTVALAIPVAFVASALRGYLPGIAGLLGIVVLTQVLSVSGAGAWFPYAAPGMWSGMGGQELAGTVTWAQLLLAIPVGLAGALATLRWWGTAEVV